MVSNKNLTPKTLLNLKKKITTSSQNKIKSRAYNLFFYNS